MRRRDNPVRHKRTGEGRELHNTLSGDMVDEVAPVGADVGKGPRCATFFRIHPPVEGGASRAFADIGTHWCDLIQHVTGQRVVRLSALTRTFVPDRVVSATHTFSAPSASLPPAGTTPSVHVRTEDAVVLHFETSAGALGSLVISQTSAGHKNDISIEIDGADAALIWQQATHEQLWMGRRDNPNGLLHKVPAQLDPSVLRFALYPAGHPEGYGDAMGSLFRLVYERVDEMREGTNAPAEPPEYPTFMDGARMLGVVEAVLMSARRGGQWIDIT